jgi:predicted regulator of amino acid metabolism with ACT domain
MKVELEFNTKLTDMLDILQKVSQMVKSAKEQGFDIVEVEVESDKESD